MKKEAFRVITALSVAVTGCTAHPQPTIDPEILPSPITTEVDPALIPTLPPLTEIDPTEPFQIAPTHTYTPLPTSTPIPTRTPTPIPGPRDQKGEAIATPIGAKRLIQENGQWVAFTNKGEIGWRFDEESQEWKREMIIGIVGVGTAYSQEELDMLDVNNILVELYSGFEEIDPHAPRHTENGKVIPFGPVGEPDEEGIVLINLRLRQATRYVVDGYEYGRILFDMPNEYYDPQTGELKVDESYQQYIPVGKPVDQRIWWIYGIENWDIATATLMPVTNDQLFSVFEELPNGSSVLFYAVTKPKANSDEGRSERWRAWEGLRDREPVRSRYSFGIVADPYIDKSYLSGR